MTRFLTNRDSPSAPVTVLARHAIRRGQEDVFDHWTRGITEDCKAFDGYLGTEVIRPVVNSTPESNNEFVSIFRFDNYDHLQIWMDSSVRAQWLARTKEFSDESPQVDYHSLEYWFSPQRHHGQAPSKHKMAIVTFLALWPLVHFIPPATARFTTSPFVTEIVSLAAIVALMTYVVMPAATRALARWLFPKSR